MCGDGRVRAARALLVFPKRADTGQQRSHPPHLPAVTNHIRWQRGRVCQVDGSVCLTLRHHLHSLPTLFLRGCADDAPSRGLAHQLCRSIRLLAFNHILVFYEVSENESVESVSAGRVEGALGYAGGGIQTEERRIVEIGGYYDVVLSKVFGVFEPDVSCEDFDFDARIEFLHLWSCGFRALIDISIGKMGRSGDCIEAAYVLSDVGFGDEELRAEVIFRY